MKKTILLMLIVCIGSGAFAQFQSGNLLFGAGIRFGMDKSESSSGNTTVDGPKTTSFEFSPGIEYFVSDKFSIGADVSFNTSKRVEENPSGGYDKYTYKSNSSSVSPFVSLYMISEERFALYCKLDASIGFGKSSNTYETGNVTDESETKYTSFSIGLSPGVHVRLSEKFGMKASFGWIGYDLSKYKYEDDSEDKNSSVTFQITPSLGFGIYYICGSANSTPAVESGEL